ncbi:MAG: hypothetical protein VX265_02630 [Myxococcota bacterium]|nr:hypothetical protein [Myxococcota bacterium]
MPRSLTAPSLLVVVLLSSTACVTEHPVTVVKGDPTAQAAAAPSVEILEPASGVVIAEDTPISIQAEILDADDPLETLALHWSSDRDGDLGAGSITGAGSASIDGVRLTPGLHTVSLTVIDDDGLSGQDIVLIEIDASPTAPVVALGPSQPTTADDLVATLTTPSVDPEGDLVTYTWTWTVDGTPSGASDADILPAAATSRDQTWTVTVTPSAGAGAGPAVSAGITIRNAAPGAAGVRIQPEIPVAGTPLTCAPDPPADDADDDPLHYDITWTVDGAPYTETATTMWPDDTVPGDVTARDETWRCTVAPSDGSLAGPPTSAEITIEHVPLASSVSAADAAALFTDGGWATSYYQALAVRGDLDYDGDGLADLLVGSAVHDTAYTDAGGAFLVRGPVSGSISLASSTDADLVFSPARPLAHAGSEVSAGDIDGDGFDELLVSAVGADSVFLLDDGLSGTVDDTSAGVSELPGHRHGTVVGDINDDGMADLLLARSFGTEASVYWGATTGPADSGETVSVLGTDMVGGAVAVVSGGVDLDGDGTPEWAAVGAGAVVTIRSGMDTMTELQDMTNYTAAVTIVHLADDLDGDGYGDALVANYSQAYDDGFTGPVSDFGRIWAFTGGVAGVTATRETDAVWTLRGSARHAYVGFDLDTTDVDGDGTLDLLIGRYRNPPVLFFGPQPTGTRDETDADVTFDDAVDAVARAGDVNGDGFNDVLVGSTEPGTGPFLHLGGPR